MSSKCLSFDWAVLFGTLSISTTSELVILPKEIIKSTSRSSSLSNIFTVSSVLPTTDRLRIWDGDSKRVEVELEEKEAGKITPGEEISVEVGGEKIKCKAGKPFPEGKGWVVRISQ